jgi:hypothetical protein
VYPSTKKEPAVQTARSKVFLTVLTLAMSKFTSTLDTAALINLIFCLTV